MAWVGTGLGGLALLATVAIALARGQLNLVGWTLVGPAPVYALGVYAVHRRPDQLVPVWLLASGSAFAIEVCLGDAVLPLIGAGPVGFVVALIRMWIGGLSVVAGIGMIGLFPTGSPDGTFERCVIWGHAGAAVLLPLINAASTPRLWSGLWPNPGDPHPVSPLFVPDLAGIGPVVSGVSQGFAAVVLWGLVLLARRYHRAEPVRRRQIRLLLVGWILSAVVWFTLAGLAWQLAPAIVEVVSAVLWPLTVVLTLGSLMLALSHNGVFGIDRPARRSRVGRGLRSLIAVASVVAAAVVGVAASRFLNTGAAVLIAATVALLLQPAQRRLEALADRALFGARLDGYGVLSRFGDILAAAPGPERLPPALAETVRLGLSLDWARVRLDLPTADGPLPAVAAAGIDPDDPSEAVLVVPLADTTGRLGDLECGPRRDGPLLAEDRRLLQHLARQAATAVRNAYLTAELSARLDVIRRQADELTASRARMAQARDGERRRIQRDLHDGVQQDVVVLSAKLAMARAQLGRGDSRGDEPLAELQADLTQLVARLREVAHAIHPPVLADQGLLEAIEAQVARLPLPVVVEADVALRGVRYPEDVETALWYVTVEALTNTVKHAAARQVVVSFSQPDGHLAVQVRDDGRGFDPVAPRGLGLSGMVDRMAVVHGRVSVDTAPGRGTVLRAEVPVTRKDTHA